MPDRTSRSRGRRLRVPASRRLSCDLLHFHRQVPLCAHDRQADLSAVATARRKARVRVSWPALFLKAYGLVAADVPQLRQSWHRFPFPHLYEHPHSVGTLTVHRMIDGDPWLFWGRILTPESQPLTQIQRLIDRCRDAPCKEVFARQLQLAALPQVLRRFTWWWNLNVATRGRARRLGTFFLSTLAGRGATIPLPPSIHTGCLTYGPLDASSQCRITLAYDHRIMDGMLVADILERLERTLNTTVAAELDQVTGTDRASGPVAA